MRVAILGNSGSGKSSLAQALAAATHGRVLDLDTIAWEPQAEVRLRPVAQAQADVRAFCQREGDWIVEGCYASLVAAALAFQPKLLFLSPGVEACLANCRARPWEPHKYASAQEREANLAPLLAWVADYDKREADLSLQAHQACFAGYTGDKRQLTALPSLSPVDPQLLAWLR